MTQVRSRSFCCATECVNVKDVFSLILNMLVIYCRTYLSNGESDVNKVEIAVVQLVPVVTSYCEEKDRSLGENMVGKSWVFFFLVFSGNQKPCNYSQEMADISAAGASKTLQLTGKKKKRKERKRITK